MAVERIQSTWEVFSTNFAKFHRLPFGTELRLYDTDGRRRRADMVVKRQRISAKSLPRVEDDENVKALLDVASGMLSMDLRARRWRLQLHAPDGELINGNEKVRTVRRRTPRPTPDELGQAEFDRALTDELQSTAYTSIVEAEHLIEDPSTTVCTAFVRALVQRYDFRAVSEALRTR